MESKFKINPNQTISLVNNDGSSIRCQYASFGSRVIARIIDVLIIGIPASILPILPALLYWGFLQSGSKQAIIGQRIMGIKLVSLDSGSVTFLQASGRWVANLLNVATLFLGFLMFFFNRKRQCLHDYIAGTVVIKDVNTH